MKKSFVYLLVLVLPYFCNAQGGDFNAKIGVRHRGQKGTEKWFDAGNGSTSFSYVKTGVYDAPRQYHIEIPDNCMLAKVRVLAQKNGQEIDRREASFSKSQNAKKLEFDSNGLMGPYMDAQGEDAVVLQLLVYQKSPDGEGYIKVPLENTTFTIYLDKEPDLLAENE